MEVVDARIGLLSVWQVQMLHLPPDFFILFQDVFSHSYVILVLHLWSATARAELPLCKIRGVSACTRMKRSCSWVGDIFQDRLKFGKGIATCLLWDRGLSRG